MRTAVLAAMALAIPATATLAASAKKAEKPLEFLGFGGRCLQVRIGDEDMTAACTGVLGRSTYVDGRIGFYFMMADNHIVTISGFDKKERNGKGKGFVIDRVVLNSGSETVPPKVLSATGRCGFPEMKRKAVTVRCSGKVGTDTKFVAAFRTDGLPPEAQ